LSKQQKIQQYIYKLNSSLLELKHWDLKLPLEQARKIDGLVVALADSQILSWINEINGTQDYDTKAKAIRKEIKFIKKQENSADNRARVSELYKELYRLQFKEDYVCVVMQNNTHYNRLYFVPPPLFRSFYGILENLIERQRLNLYLWQKLNNAKIRTASWSRLKGHSILACKVQQKTYPEP
jgi:hypothetical protein